MLVRNTTWTMSRDTQLGLDFTGVNYYDGQGFLVRKKPWPSMLRTIVGDHDRYVQTCFSEVPDCYFAGDGARRDKDGYFWLMGRVDDVMKISGHRISTTEVESALVDHKSVAEAAVEERVSPGETLVVEGAVEAHLYAIVEGRVRVHCGGRTVVELGPGATVGELAALVPAPRAASGPAGSAGRRASRGCSRSHARAAAGPQRGVGRARGPAGPPAGRHRTCRQRS